LFYAYNTHNFYIKQYCYESTSKVDNKTVNFIFFFRFPYKVAYCVVRYCLYFNCRNGFIILCNQ